MSVALLGLLLAFHVARGTRAMAAEFQYSVPVPTVEGRRAYLWIPPHCTRVRGLLFCLNNMLEEHIVLDPTLRHTFADLGMGIVWVHPGGEPSGGSPLDIAMRYGKPADALQQVLTHLAEESGYSEIQYAPLILMQHSASSPFGYGLQSQIPERIIAAIPIKTWFPGWKALGIPNLQIASCEGDRGTGWVPAMWQKDLSAVANYRAQDPRCLMGEMVDVGATHFFFTPASAKPISMFIRKAVQLRVPEDAPTDGPVQLMVIDPASGWLIAPEKLGTPQANPVPVSQWHGDPTHGLWYFDKEMATTVNDYMLDQAKKKPQFIEARSNGKPLPIDSFRKAEVRASFNEDGVTFKVAADWYARVPATQPAGQTPVGHGAQPIEFTASSGALDQVGPDTFRVDLHRGIVLNQGNPWEPFIIAHVEGDADYAQSQRPMHILISIVNKTGDAQTLDFPKIGDVNANHLRPLRLDAKATSGLPIQYFVVSGPCTIQGETLTFDEIPPRTRFPMRVLVSAFQWGRQGRSPIQSAGPVTQEFFVNR